MAMRMELNGQGAVEPPFERGLAAAEHALAILPGNPDALLLESSLLRDFAEHEERQGRDVEALLTRAIAATERALTAAPERPQPKALLERGRIYWLWARFREDGHRDPREMLRKAKEDFDSVGLADRDYDYYVFLGLIYKLWADYEDQVGAASLPNRGKAIEAYLAALHLDERIPDGWINLGINYFLRASQPGCPAPDSDLKQADAALEKAEALNPKHFVPYLYRGQVHTEMARRERARGGDARADLDRALDQIRQGLAINKKLPHFYNLAGTVLMEQATEAWDRGGAPEPLLDRAIAEFEQAVAVAPQQGFAQNNIGEALIQRASYQRARGEDPSSSVRAAVAALEQAVPWMREHETVWANLGRIRSLQASFELGRGRSPERSLAAAAAAVDEALRRKPADALSQRILGEVRGTRARWLALKGQAASVDFERAAQAFQKAIELAPEDQGHRIAFGHFCRAWASWLQATGGDSMPAIRRGLELADGLRALRPEWPDALLLRAELLLAEAERSTRPEERRALGDRALQELIGALAINSSLRQTYAAQVALARQLAAAPQ
jgi:serine/threonine-protein kinase